MYFHNVKINILTTRTNRLSLLKSLKITAVAQTGTTAVNNEKVQCVIWYRTGQCATSNLDAAALTSRADQGKGRPAGRMRPASCL